MMLYLSDIIKMKFLFGTTRDAYDEYKEIEINTLEELIELIKNSE
jgi:predicted RecB family nuclease